MKKIDTSDWSIVKVSVGDMTITHRTLQSEAYFIRLCAEHDWELISFQKGTSPLCE
jgi:hypothetical protein